MPPSNDAAKPMSLRPLTLEQMRASDAWHRAQSQNQNAEYAILAKGLPALIMNSGLLQVMAFLNEKGKKESQKHCAVLGEHLRAWANKRFGKDVPADFAGFMNALMSADSRKFQMVTSECLAWLRWLRQIAAAVVREEA
jgi:CRISPR-associated protein Cmr5